MFNNYIWQKHLKNLFEPNSLTVNHNVDFLLPDFDYRYYYVSFFKKMAETGWKKYVKPNFLSKEIDNFGNSFKTAYTKEFNSCDWLKKKFEKNLLNSEDYINDLKNKFTGNLAEAICGMYCSEFEIIEGFEFDSWANGGSDDMQGADGFLRMIDNHEIKIPLNTKHIKAGEIDKYAPFQKLNNWNWMNLKCLGDENKLIKSKLTFDGIIWTTLNANEMIAKTFNSILIISADKIHKNLGNFGDAEITKQKIWQRWYDIVK